MLWLVVAIAAFLLSWVVPAAKVPLVNPSLGLGNEMYFGWQAFWVTLSLFWQPVGLDNSKDAVEFVLSTSTALTNFLFIIAAIAIAMPHSFWTRGVSWVLLLAAALDSYWYFTLGDLRIGYYLWVASFLLLAAAAFTKKAAARSQPPANSH